MVVDSSVQVEMGFITEPDQVDPVWVPLHPVTEPIAHIKSPSHVILTQFMPNRDDGQGICTQWPNLFKKFHDSFGIY